MPPQLAVAAVLTGLSFAALVLFDVWNARRIAAESDGIGRNAAPSTLHVTAARSSLRQLAEDLDDALLAAAAGRPTDLGAVRGDASRLDGEISEYRALPAYPGEIALADEVAASRARLQRGLDHLEERLAAGNFGAATALDQGELRAARDHLDDGLRQLVDFNLGHLVRHTERIDSAWHVLLAGSLLLGALCLLLAWISAEVAHRAVRRRIEFEAELAREDPLTGVANRRAFLETMGHEIARAKERGLPLSLAVLDFDRFKEVNDSRGHAEGDRLLRASVEVIRQALRHTDVLSRLGGDEFAIVMPEASSDQALAIVERVRGAWADAASGAGWPVRFSVGLATLTGAGSGADELMRAADAELYAVKAAGCDAARARILAP